jgi:Flagellar hook-length control protein FliK
MLARVDITGTRPVASIEAATPVTAVGNPRQETLHRLTQIALGTQLEAEVLSPYDDGTFLVKVADTVARMRLPTGTHAGDTLSMKLVSTEPRFTFLLTPQASSTPTSLSTAGRLIDSLLHTAQQEGVSTAIIGKTPIIASGIPDTQQFAATLQDTINSSGLFYESHVGEWATGTRTLTDLAREPQMQSGNNGNISASPVTDHEKPLSAESAGTKTLLKTEAIDTESLQIVSQQLNTLEQRRILWQGEIWPGQPMEWEISDDTPEGQGEHHKEDEKTQSWKSVVRFDLPSLGLISIKIHLLGERVHVQMHTANETKASSLRTHASSLADALGAAGSPLDSFLIKQDEPS